LLNGTKQIIHSTVACWFVILFLAWLPYIYTTEPKLVTFLQSTTVSPTIQTPATPTDVYSNSYISLRFRRLMTNTYFYSRSFALGDFEQTRNKSVFLVTTQQMKHNTNISVRIHTYTLEILKGVHNHPILLWLCQL